MKKLKLYRYRFYTKSVNDYRPLLFSPFVERQLPWWCTGYAADMSHAVIVRYLYSDMKLKDFWDDAYNIDKEECSEITYTDRFPKPEWVEHPEKYLNKIQNESNPKK